jgi:hypothetical protein
VANRDQDATAFVGVDAIVRGRDLFEGQWVRDGDVESACGGSCGEVGRCFALGFGGEVVAAKKPNRDVVEQHRPERKVWPVVSGRVRGDDGADLRNSGVQVSVVGESTFDDPLDAAMG